MEYMYIYLFAENVAVKLTLTSESTPLSKRINNLHLNSIDVYKT